MKTLTKLELIQIVQKELTPLYMKAKDSKYDFLVDAKLASAKEYKTRWQNLKEFISKSDQSLMDWSNTVILEKLNTKYNNMIEDMALKIESKLQGYDIATIERVKVSGYDIEFLLNSNKRFTIHTIQAGGYNVQCLHYRTTYKLHK